MSPRWSGCAPVLRPACLPGPAGLLRAAILLLFCLAAGTASAAQTLALAVATYRPPEHSLQQWQPLADYLTEKLNGPQVVLVALSHDEIRDRLARQTVDVVITEASDYVMLRNRNPLTALLATRVPQYQGKRMIGSGGVIFARSARDDIGGLAQLPGKRIAAVHPASLGGYQAQLMSLAQEGIAREALGPVRFVGGAHDQVVDAVLAGEADVGFARSGLLEALIAEGRLEAGALKVLNAQDLPSYPYALSTRLYPEWPVFAAAHLKPELARRIAAALMTLEPDQAAAVAAGIAGFEPAADYSPVENLLRSLRLPPYDLTPAFSLADVWARHRTAILLGGASILAIAGLALALGRINVRLRAEKLTLEQARQALSLSDQRNRETLTTLAQTLAELESERTRLDNIIWGTGACSWEWDIATATVRMNERWANFVGHRLDELLPTTIETWRRFVHPEDLIRAEAALRRHLDGDIDHYECEYRLHRRDGAWRWVLDRGRIVERDRAGKPLRMVGTHTDIQRLKEQESALHSLAHLDPLTQLPNRRLFSDRLRHALARAVRGGARLAVCFIDLDAFKPINDRLGHDAGDRVLIEIGERLRRTLRGADSVARIGGDEFALLIEDAADVGEDLLPLLERCLSAISQPIAIGEHRVVVSASIGVALFPQHGDDEEALVHAADKAMYAAKALGKNRYCLAAQPPSELPARPPEAG